MKKNLKKLVKRSNKQLATISADQLSTVQGGIRLGGLHTVRMELV